MQHLLDDKNTDISILKVLNQLKTEDFSDVLNKETLEKIRNALFTFERHIYYSFGYMAGIIPQPASGRDPRIKNIFILLRMRRNKNLLRLLNLKLNGVICLMILPNINGVLRKLQKQPSIRIGDIWKLFFT